MCRRYIKPTEPSSIINIYYTSKMVTNIEERPGYDSSQFVAGEFSFKIWLNLLFALSPSSLNKKTNLSWNQNFIFRFGWHAWIPARFICNRTDRRAGEDFGSSVPRPVHQRLQGEEKRAGRTRQEMWKKSAKKRARWKTKIFCRVRRQFGSRSRAMRKILIFERKSARLCKKINNV